MSTQKIPFQTMYSSLIKICMFLPLLKCKFLVLHVHVQLCTQHKWINKTISLLSKYLVITCNNILAIPRGDALHQLINNGHKLTSVTVAQKKHLSYRDVAQIVGWLEMSKLKKYITHYRYLYDWNSVNELLVASTPKIVYYHSL